MAQLFLFLTLFVSRVRRVRSPPRDFYFMFGRMPGIEPELLRPQLAVLPMSYTQPFHISIRRLSFVAVVVLLAVLAQLYTSLPKSYVYISGAAFSAQEFSRRKPDNLT